MRLLALAFIGWIFWTLPLSRAGEKVNLKSLEALISSGAVHSIEDLLARLPPNYLKHYTLMYKSRSIQSASFEFPRVIVYGPDAKFMIAFTGDPKEKGFQKLEVIEWDEKEENFAFSEIDFSKISITNNPEKCKDCHHKESRPNWDPYSFWTGAYGSISGGGEDKIKRGTPEDLGYQLFLKNQKNKGRYKYLPMLSLAIDGRTQGPDSYLTANGATYDGNAFLTGALNYLNIIRISNSVLKKEGSDKFRYALQALALRCENIDGFFPTHLKKNGKSLELLRAETEEISKKEFQTRKKRLQEFNDPYVVNSKGPLNFVSGDDREGYALEDLVDTRFVMSRMGISLRDWSMAFDEGQFDFSGPGMGFPNFILSLGVKLKKKYPDLPVSCDRLRDLSLNELKNERCVSAEEARFKPLGALLKANEVANFALGKDLLEARCAKCHSTENAEARYFPFNSQEKLKAALIGPRGLKLYLRIEERTRPGARYPMPPEGAPLSKKEADSIRIYLHSLMSLRTGVE